jgi:hypothetical protein
MKSMKNITEKRISWQVMKNMAEKGIGHTNLLKYAEQIRKNEKKKSSNTK